MSCADFARYAVADDPRERAAAAAHAATCMECARRLEGWARVGALAAEWGSERVEPSAALAARVRLLGATTNPAVHPATAIASRSARLDSTGRRARRLAAVALAGAMAATVALAIGLAWRSQQAPGAVSGGLVAAEALREAEAAAEANARAIARLEAAAQPYLRTANLPELSAEQAALLLSYQERLRFLDRTLAEIQGFLDENPYNARARTLLLAGTIEKREILRGVLTLAAPTSGGSAS